MSLGISKTFGILFIPFLGAAGVIAYVARQAVTTVESETAELQTYIRASELTNESSLAVSEMGSALKGYLLNPKNEQEAKNKGDADERNATALGQMKKLIHDEAELKLIVAMEEFDEKQLNPAEDNAITLVKKGSVAEAQAYFISDYLPLRSQYDAMSRNLLTHVAKLTADKLAQFQSNISKPISQIIVTLILALAAFAAAMVAVVIRLSRKLTKVVETLKTEASQVAVISDQVTDSGEELSSAASTQASALQETAASLDELNAMVRRNAESSRESNTVSKKNQDSASRGRDAVRDMLAAIKRIDESNGDITRQVEASNNEIMSIASMISEIGAKTKVINDIVFQTKLLSFNASVEAARAGEHGKGFAVVAEEVGNLAQMSGNAAREITEMLDSNIKKVETIVRDMKTRIDSLVRVGREEVGNGLRTAENCNSSLEEIVQQSQNLGRMIEDISSASMEQTKGLDEIARALQQLDRVLNQNSAIAGTSAKQGQILQQRARELNSMVEGLHAVVRGGPEGAQRVTTTSGPTSEQTRDDDSTPDLRAAS